VSLISNRLLLLHTSGDGAEASTPSPPLIDSPEMADPFHISGTYTFPSIGLRFDSIFRFFKAVESPWPWAIQHQTGALSSLVFREDPSKYTACYLMEPNEPSFTSSKFKLPISSTRSAMSFNASTDLGELIQWEVDS